MEQPINYDSLPANEMELDVEQPKSELSEKGQDRLRWLQKAFGRLTKSAIAAQLVGQAYVVAIETSRIQDQAEKESANADRSTLESVEKDYLNDVYGSSWVISDDSMSDLEAHGILVADAQETSTHLEGFEQLDIDTTEARALFADQYPKGWIDADIHSIVFEPDNVDSMPSQYGINGIAGGRAEFTVDGTVVRVFSKSLGESMVIHSHEVGHANDWVRDQNSTAEAKRSLLINVTQRFLKGDSLYQSAYVDSIKNPDPKLELYTKVTEYWAEICQEYFEFPTLLKQDHPEDYQLVDQWVRQTDPHFDPEKITEKRNAILAPIRLRKSLREIPVEYRQGFEEVAEKIWATNQQRNQKYFEKYGTRAFASMNEEEATWVDEFADKAGINRMKARNAAFDWLDVKVLQ